jgi:hypothetical protein
MQLLEVDVDLSAFQKLGFSPDGKYLALGIFIWKLYDDGLWYPFKRLGSGMPAAREVLFTPRRHSSCQCGYEVLIFQPTSTALWQYYSFIRENFHRHMEVWVSEKPTGDYLYAYDILTSWPLGMDALSAVLSPQGTCLVMWRVQRHSSGGRLPTRLNIHEIDYSDSSGLLQVGTIDAPVTTAAFSWTNHLALGLVNGAVCLLRAQRSAKYDWRLEQIIHTDRATVQSLHFSTQHLLVLRNGGKMEMFEEVVSNEAV